MSDPIPFYEAAQEFNPAIPVSSISEHPENYNEGDTEAIARSLDKHGFYGAVLVQRSTGHVIAGNHRLRSAAAKGATTIPGFLLDVDDDEARRIMADDNQTTHLATFNEDRLIALLKRTEESEGGLPATFDANALALLVRHQASVSSTPTNPRDEWEGMPGFDQPGQPPAYSVVMHFPTQEDADAFFALIERERPRTKYLWWPTHDGFRGLDYSRAEVIVDDGVDDGDQ
jgi:hypothetical protein